MATMRDWFVKRLLSIMSRKKKLNKLMRSMSFFEKRGNILLAHFYKNQIEKHFQIFIGIHTSVSDTVRFPHPSGIIIGEGVTIGEGCVIYHQVTIGGKDRNLPPPKKYPIIGKNVTIYAGAMLLGDIYIGDNSVIGANSVVMTNVEPNSVYAGIPAKRIR